MRSRVARSWQPRRHRKPFRPVALRPRLSTGLPLSLAPVSKRRALQSSPHSVSRLSAPHLTGYVLLPGAVHRTPEAPGALEVARIETAGAQLAVLHREPGARGVDKAAAAGVDADVIDGAPAQAEEHQVPGRELRERHRRGGALLLEGGARNEDADALVHVAREPAAVEAGLIRPAELVRGADEGGGERGDRRPLGRRGDGRARGRRAAGAECQRGGEGERGAHREPPVRGYFVPSAFGCAAARTRPAAIRARASIPSKV